MKKYVSAVIYLSAMLTLTGCNNAVNHFVDFLDERIEDLSDENTDDEFAFELDDVAYAENEEDCKNYYYEFVNPDVYENLRFAYDSFEKFRESGAASKQMKSNGSKLSSTDAEYIDDHMELCYKLINQYVAAYESNDVEKCYEIGKELYDLYYSFGPDVLYKIKIMQNLPKDFQSPIVDGNSYDSMGNIILENGNKICLIGPPDDIVGEVPDYGDLYDDMYFRSRWFRNIPAFILDYYDVFNAKDDGNVCYIMDYSLAERACRRGWEEIYAEGREMYDDNRINGVNDYYFYIDKKKIGKLSSEQIDRVNDIYYIEDIVVSHEGDPYQVDTAYKSIVYGLQEHGYQMYLQSSSK